MRKPWRDGLLEASGYALIGLGVVDGIWNPFAFITAPQLLTAGTALIALSRGQRGKGENSDGKY